MSGLVGAIDLVGRPVEDGVLRGMATPISHRGQDGSGYWTDGPVGMGALLSCTAPESVGERQPAIGSSGCVCVFDGRLDDRPALIGRLHGRCSPDAPDSVLVLKGYETLGECLFLHLDGEFALAIWDPRRQTLVLARDILGVRPLYYAQRRSGLVFGSEVKAVLAHPQVQASPNDAYIAEWLMGGLGTTDYRGDTFFASVSGVVPGHVVRTTPSGITQRRFDDLDHHRRVRLGSFDEYAEGFRHHFEKAVRRRLRSVAPVAVAVSGGLDSSSIFCQAVALEAVGEVPAVLGLSHVPRAAPVGNESDYLDALEQTTGRMLERIHYDTRDLLEFAPRMARDTEGPVPASPYPDEMLVQRARDLGVRQILYGVWGDQVIDNHGYLVDLTNRGRFLEAWGLLRSVPDWTRDVDPRWLRNAFLLEWARSLAPEASRPILRSLEGRLRSAERTKPWFGEWMRQQGHSVPTRRLWDGLTFQGQHARTIYARLRSGKAVWQLEAMNKIGAAMGTEFAFPFLDRDLVEYLMAVPGEVFLHGGIHRAILRAAMAPLLPGKIAGRRWKADFTRFWSDSFGQDMWGRASQLARAGLSVERGYVEPACLFGALVERGAWSEGGVTRRSIALPEVFSLEAWLQEWFFLESQARS